MQRLAASQPCNAFGGCRGGRASLGRAHYAQRGLPVARRAVVASVTKLQFIPGVDEPVVPEVKLSRSRMGNSGTATFLFDNPSVFQASSELGDITGLFMVDDEGELTTTDVKAKFVNGKPQAIEAKYQMRSQFEWDRFLRFMDRYAEDQGLGFEKK